MTGRRPATYPSTAFGGGRRTPYMCYFTTACFWTYPIVCPLAIVVLFWTNMLDKRLFYECLFHKVFLQQHSMSYLTSWTFWLLLLHFVCGMSCVFFKDLQEDDLLRHETAFGFFAYFSSCVAFLYVLFTNWSVNRLVVPLPMFVENDLNGAMTLLKDCKFIRDVDFWRYFQSAETLFEQVCLRRRMSFTMTTSEMILLIHEPTEAPESLEPQTCRSPPGQGLPARPQLPRAPLPPLLGVAFPLLPRGAGPAVEELSAVVPGLLRDRRPSRASCSGTRWCTRSTRCCSSRVPSRTGPCPCRRRTRCQARSRTDVANDAPDMMREGGRKLPLVGELVPPVKCSVMDGSGFSSESSSPPPPCTGSRLRRAGAASGSDRRGRAFLPCPPSGVSVYLRFRHVLGEPGLRRHLQHMSARGRDPGRVAVQWKRHRCPPLSQGREHAERRAVLRQR
ncbi:unnamed protein product [Prorocentrum cordatum]|uniref:Glycerophosphocholine acyltransferase 1 n=1 Tax=Prorocentrum cordatum TaxID=2364126 RepID=A0ABN9RDZ0_9DINO|nr:unnamed protein product [Polarella glacialis]